jgi:hypothetical protein
MDRWMIQLMQVVRRSPVRAVLRREVVLQPHRAAVAPVVDAAAATPAARIRQGFRLSRPADLASTRFTRRQVSSTAKASPATPIVTRRTAGSPR